MTNASSEQSDYYAKTQVQQYGEENPIEKILHCQEDSVEQVSQVQEETSVKEVCQRDCQDCVTTLSQGIQSAEEEDRCPNTP